MVNGCSTPQYIREVTREGSKVGSFPVISEIFGSEMIIIAHSFGPGIVCDGGGVENEDVLSVLAASADERGMLSRSRCFDR